MRRILLIAVCALLTCAAMAQEAVPDGTSYSVFSVAYDESLLKSWQTVSYFEASGLLFSAYVDDAEITVSLDESGGARSAEAFLGAHKNNVSRYGRVLSAQDPEAWADPWGAGGACMRYSYMYLSGADTDDVYHTLIYASPVSANYFAVITLNCWGDGASARERAFIDSFLPSLRLDTRRVSTLFMAYMKGVSERDGAICLTLDFCTVEYDSSIFTVYTENDTPADYTYALSENALIWLPDMRSALYTARKTAPTVEELTRLIDEYYAQNNMNGIYQVLFDENNEIVWMMHYNAF